VISYLGDFLFPPERARAKVGSLSGGERNRLLLARLFSRPANVLVLDEPTNDLDIETLELLEELLQDYDGTLLLVSHDRTFLDNVVTQSIASEGNGEWREYAGGYSDWEAARSRAAALSSTQKAEAKPAVVRESAPPATPAKAKAKLGFKEQRELDGLPAKLEALERELESVNARLGEPALYRDHQPGEVKTLRERHAALEAEIAHGYARWEELEAKL
jgi:ATP-binding cassette subfamily F protein uup